MQSKALSLLRFAGLVLVPVISMVGNSQGEAQEPSRTTLVFTDGTRMEVLAYEERGGVVLLTTVEGELHSIPRTLIDMDATRAANRASGESPSSAASPSPDETDPEERPAPPPAPTPPQAPPPAPTPPRPPRPPRQEHAATESTRQGEPSHTEDHGESRLSDEPIPLQLEGFPNRPKPLLELGSPFLGTGNIRRGFRLPGGAIWQPSFLLFGSFRTAVSVLDDEVTEVTQWSNRLDLFGNLYLSGTERIVFGLRPLDETGPGGGRQFSGYRSFSPDPFDASGSDEHFNLNWDTVSHLFFEGELGEIFPGLARSALDFGFSVGRQPINFQEGLLINDTIDAIGITRNNLKPGGTVNFRITGLIAWNQINRNTPGAGVLRNREGESALLLGVFNEIDWRFTTFAFDAIYLDGGVFRGPGVSVDAGSGIYAGVSFVQRFGSFNSAFRVLGSAPVGDRTPADNSLRVGDPATRGILVFAETSWTPHHTHNFFYLNGFYAIDDYRAAALDPTIPGPLARTGILFAGAPVGNYGAALSPTASDAAGASFGHQRFFAHTRQQLLIEAAARYSTGECPDELSLCDPHAFAFGARYQIALGRRGVAIVEGFGAYDSLRGIAVSVFGDDARIRVGSRVELQIKF